MHKLNTSKDLDALVSDIDDKSIVMLGEASHGTHEFYTWRSAISKRLMDLTVILISPFFPAIKSRKSRG